MNNYSNTVKKRKTLKILLSITVILLLIRLILPYAVLQYAEYRLNKIPEYRASIGDIAIHLYKGSYVIKDLQLRKINKNIPVPFFSAKSIELAVEWTPLLHGKFVAQLDVYDPGINFVVDPTGKDEQTTIDAEWQNAVKALFPLNFNRITIHNGQAHLRNFKSQPNYDIYLKNIDAQVDNLRNANRTQQLLVSNLTVSAQTMDGAAIDLNVAFNPFKQQPTFDMDAEVKQMQVSAINDFLRYYTKIDIKQGLFSLYVEAAAKDGKITGYAKPLIEHLRVTDSTEKTDPVTKIYKGAVQAVTKLLENPQKKTVATKIKISGNIDDPNVSIWPVILNLLKNAFIQALLPQIDNTIELKDVNLNN
jgi:hypothetical protein